MYSTCLFCHGSLGRNEVVEHFPVGRRLAFDAAKGRLWAVCPSCARWNLTPLDERWEAIEECERLFRTLPAGPTTDNVATAGSRRFALVHIGGVTRLELATWRFASRMRRLHRRDAVRRLIDENEDILRGLGSLASALAGAGGVGRLLVAGALAAKARAEEAQLRALDRRVALRVADHAAPITVGDVRQGVLVRSAGGGYEVQLTHEGRQVGLAGQHARSALLSALAVTNRRGAREMELGIAVDRLAEVGEPEAYVDVLLRAAERRNDPAAVERRLRRGEPARRDDSIGAMDRFAQITLDLALSEHADAAATSAELAALEQAWRDAEEIAAIADGLLLPDSVDEKLKRLRDE